MTAACGWIALLTATLLPSPPDIAEMAAAARAGQVGAAAAASERRFTEEIVVTATTTERPAWDLPYAVATLSSSDLRRRLMARTLPEAMRELPGVRVQKTAHGQGSPFIRGFTGFRNLLLIDGIRLNNSVFRSGPNQYWATVDPLAIERLEVVKGTFSVLYGSDAVGGTVNALAGLPSGAGGADLLTGRVYLRSASAEDSRLGRLQLAGRGGRRFRYRLGSSLKAFGDLTAGDEVGRQPRTGYDEWHVDFKGAFELDDVRQLAVGFQNSRLDDVWRTHRTIFGVSWRGTTVGDERRRSTDQERLLGYVQLSDSSSTALWDKLEASLSYHVQEEARLRVRGDGRRDRQGFEVATTGAWLRLQKRTGSGTLSYGLELYHDRVDSFSRRYRADGSFERSEIQGPVADDATYDLWGVYAQHDLTVGPRLRLLLGARYNRAEARAGRVADPLGGGATTLVDSWDKVVGNLRLLYRLDTGVHLFTGLSQGFRAPNLSDLTRLDSARSNELEVPSPGLRPESFVSWELGLKARGVWGAAEAAYFYTDAQGLIARTPTGSTIDGEIQVTKRNSGDGFVHGLELSGKLELTSRLSLFMAASFIDGEVETPTDDDAGRIREPFDRLAPPNGHLGLRWRAARREGWAELLLTATGRQDRLSTRDRADTQRIPPGGTPGYQVLTVRGGLALTAGLSLQAALENLTDEDYRIHGSGVNQAGTNLVVSLEADF